MCDVPPAPPGEPIAEMTYSGYAGMPALSLLFALRRRHPRDPELLGRLGNLLSWVGRRPDAAEVLLEQARLYLDEGSNLRALAASDMALRFGAGHLEETHTLKGWILADLGCLHEAWQSLDAAYQLASSSSSDQPRPGG